jgi:tetratricopeptide (TPR) repeat protein
MRRAEIALIALVIAACATPLEVGERLYREGDRLGALEVWRAAAEEDPGHPAIQERITAVEEESEQLVVRYKKRGSDFEAKDQLAESIIDYRIALKLQPDDAPSLARVQELARALATRKAELEASYRVSFSEKDLAAARRGLDDLRRLDPFDPELESEERRFQDTLRAEVKHQLATGRLALAKGKHAAASRAFRAVLALEPDNESAKGHLSYIEIRLENEASGEEPATFEAPAAFASEDEIRAGGFYKPADGLYEIGLLAEGDDDFFKAIDYYERALKADPGHSNARSHLAEIRRRLAGDVEGLIEKGREEFRNEELQHALDLWRQALLIDPDNERAQAYLERAERQLYNLERLRSEPDVSGGQD